MPTIPEALTLALQYHQAGHVTQAEHVYRQILQVQPNHADALHLLGVAASQQGRQHQAVDFIAQAIAIDGRQAHYHNNLGEVYRLSGRIPEAIASYQRALRLLPGFAASYNNLAIVLKEQGKQDEALACCREALRLQPAFPGAFNTLGILQAGNGRPEEAAAAYRQAITLQPSFAEAHNNLGNVLTDLERLDEALVCFREAVRLQPTFAEAHSNQGNVLKKLERVAEAVACYREAVRLRPTFAAAHNNLANALQECGQPEEALSCYREALRLQPEFPEAISNMGNVLTDLGRIEEGLACYAQSLRLRPEGADAHWSRAMAWLLTGNYEDGWREYEWRRQVPAYRPQSYPQPLWDGSSLEGKTILLHHEQGVGDTIQFIRYAALVKQTGATVLFACPPPLESLLRCCPGIDRLLHLGSVLPPFDVQAPLISLPFLLKTTLATVPAPIPYLAADPELVEHWRPELATIQGFKIGIVWQGNPSYRKDHLRSVRLEQLEPLARLPGVRLISLQKAPGNEQLAPVGAAWNVVDVAGRLNTWADTATIVSQLDLVVSVDTAVAHLAGALGVPVWIALPFIPDWRWLLDREDSPWYPSARLFRQTQRGDWAGVFSRIAAALAKRQLDARP
jgi:tetratricopeptide (TPR) repeat protein